MSYLEWDIDDADLEYQFTKEEIQNVDIIEMINLDIRGGYSTYTLPMDIEAGKIITIRNRDFGYTSTNNYIGVKFILNKNQQAEKSSYWFFFKEQIATFFFNGKEWIMTNIWPQVIASTNFIQDKTIENGYIDVKDFLDLSKKILFNNLDLNDNDVININNRFFRQGDYNKVQEDEFKIHKHTDEAHTHNIKSVLGGLNRSIQKLMNKKDQIPPFLREIAENITKNTNTQPHHILGIFSQIRNISQQLQEEEQNEFNRHYNYLKQIVPIKEILNYCISISETKEIDIPEEIIGAILGIAKKTYDQLIDYIKNNLDSLWDLAIKIIQEKNPALAIILRLKVKEIKEFILNWIKNESANFKDKLIKELENIIRNTPEIIGIIGEITNYILNNIVLVDSTLTVCEESDSDNVRVICSIPNTYLPGSEPHDDGMGISDGIKQLFSVDTTSETAININENIDGLEETRPNNVQGTYIIKCW